MTTPDNHPELDILNLRYHELNERLPGALRHERNEILRQIDEIARQLRELELDDRIRSSMEGGSEV